MQTKKRFKFRVSGLRQKQKSLFSTEFLAIEWGFGYDAGKGKPVPAKKKTLYYTEPLFEDLKKDYCYVCGKRIKKDEGLNIGNNLWRHKVCKPGSAHWLRSTHAKDESTLEIFKA